MWRKSFSINLEACRLIANNFTIKWTPSQVFFASILSSPHAPPMFWLKIPPPPCFDLSPFYSEDISVFVTTFWSCRESGLIRRIRLTSKFMASQPGLQTIVIHILLNISLSKGNQTMKYGQLIEYNMRNTFLQKLCRKWGKETSSKPLLFFYKSLIRGKSKWSAAYFQYILIALNLPYNRNKLYKALDY